MPMRCWADLGAVAALMLAGCASVGAVAPERRAAHSGSTRKPGGVIAVPVAGHAIRVPVALDPSMIDQRGDHQVKIIGVRGTSLLLLDSYASRPRSMSRCQAGQERYVRVIDTRKRTEQWSKLAESCLNDVVPGDPIAAWGADGRSFTVNLLSEPSIHANLAADGTVSVAS